MYDDPETTSFFSLTHRPSAPALSEHMHGDRVSHDQSFDDNHSSEQKSRMLYYG